MRADLAIQCGNGRTPTASSHAINAARLKHAPHTQEDAAAARGRGSRKHSEVNYSEDQLTETEFLSLVDSGFSFLFLNLDLSDCTRIVPFKLKKSEICSLCAFHCCRQDLESAMLEK
jgi:hypothetical protein